MAERPEMREIATTQDGRDITRGYVNALPILQPQDKILLARGGSYETYEEILRDDQVKATFEQRRLAVVSKEWEVRPGGEKRADKNAAKFLEEQLHRIGWDRLTERMLFGVFYGYGIGECLWARDGNFIALDQVKVRKARRFAFAPDMSLRLLTTAKPLGEELPPRKFWTYATGADNDDEPYGLGLAHWLYWPVFFKRNGLKFWLIFLEKFGQPTSKGTYPVNATADERNKLLAALQAIQVDAALIVPEGMQVELIEAARSGTADYTALHDRMNAAISKVVTGHSATSDATPGKLGGEDASIEIRDDLVKADADLVCESFNRSVARWLTDWNFPGAAYPEVWRRTDEEPDLKPQAERDAIITGMGFRPSLKYINDTYGGEWTEPVAQAPSSAGALVAQAPTPASDGRLQAGAPALQAAFADPAGRLPAARQGADLTPIDPHTDRLSEEAAPPLKAMLDQIRQLAEEAESLEQLRDRLLTAYGDLDTAALTSVMQMAFAAADLAGRYDVAAESGDLP